MEKHITDPAFWKNADGSPVAPFMVITAEDVEAGRFVPVDPTKKDEALRILKQKPEDVWPKF